VCQLLASHAHPHAGHKFWGRMNGQRLFDLAFERRVR
jgi:hypothetical protein